MLFYWKLHNLHVALLITVTCHVLALLEILHPCAQQLESECDRINQFVGQTAKTGLCKVLRFKLMLNYCRGKPGIKHHLCGQVFQQSHYANSLFSPDTERYSLVSPEGTHSIPGQHFTLRNQLELTVQSRPSDTYQREVVVLLINTALFANPFNIQIFTIILGADFAGRGVPVGTNRHTALNCKNQR